MVDLKDQLSDETAQFKSATDSLKEKEREVIDYYASDLADMAVYLVNAWLMLQDGRVSDRKRELVRMYIVEHLPQVQRARQAILNAGKMSPETRTSVLTIT
jgi:hypothetical protein